MNYSYRILKYLYKKSNDGEFHELGEAFRKKEKISIKVVNQKAWELYKQDYIELMENNARFYNTEDGTPNTPEKFDSGKIKTEGEQHIENQTIRLGNCIVRKNTLGYIIVFAVVIPILIILVERLLPK